MQSKGTKKKRDRISMMLYVGYLLTLVLLAFVIIRFFYLQVIWNPDENIYNALTPQVSHTKLNPTRGNILDCKGRLLAMSAPIYHLHMDCTVQKDANMRLMNSSSKKDQQKGKNREQAWRDSARVLAGQLAQVFPEKSANEYYRIIINGREKGKKYVPIGNAMDRNTYNKVKNFTLYREGQNKGGAIIEDEYIRKYPYGSLARRTIGFVRNNELVDVNNNLVGIEGKFNPYLHGQDGVIYYRRTEQGRMRDNDSLYREPINGNDIVTTLDVDYQEIADKALRAQIEGRTDVMGATLAMMDVKTGAIKVMVNLSYNRANNSFEEVSNMIVGRKNEPGSVFKTVTLLNLLEDGYINSLDETIEVGNGTVPGTNISCAHVIEDYCQKGKKEISIIDGFKISSNYVFAKLVIDHYGPRQDKFIKNLHEMKLGEAFDFDLDGLLCPFLPSVKEGKSISKNDFGRLGFGYFSEETPLHILTFYNAIAAKGKMMRPYLVEKVVKNGEVVSEFGPAVLCRSICSRAVADTLTRALKAVTSDGTAKWSLAGAACEVAGKTGTSFGVYEGGGYSQNGRKKYQSTFVGYFPADDPVYSIISTVYSYPSLTDPSLQGGGIPAKAIKTTINGIYNIDPAFRSKLQE